MNTINEFLAETRGKGFNINSICIQDDNRPFLWGPDEVVNVHSAAKTVTALALGLFLDEHSEVTLNDHVMFYFPDYVDKCFPSTEIIRIRDLLHMQSGKEIQSLLLHHDNDCWNDDWLQCFTEYPLSSFPGTTFFYSSQCCYIIGRIIEAISSEDINEFLEKRFWQPLSINKPAWSKCPSGYTNCAGNLLLRCSDLAKIGWVVLNGGAYNSQRLSISESFMHDMCYDIVSSNDPFGKMDAECSAGYGYFVWKCLGKGYYRIWGAGSNISLWNYDAHKCVTITSSTDAQNWKERNDQDLVRLIKKYFFGGKYEYDE